MGFGLNSVSENGSDDRSAFAKAIDLASQVTTISIMMALPALIGHWIDRRLNTVALFMLLGFALGMTGGIWQLIKLINKRDQSGPKK